MESDLIALNGLLERVENILCLTEDEVLQKDSNEESLTDESRLLIETIMNQENVSFDVAKNALESNNYELINALMVTKFYRTWTNVFAWKLKQYVVRFELSIKIIAEIIKLDDSFLFYQ